MRRCLCMIVLCLVTVLPADALEPPEVELAFVLVDFYDVPAELALEWSVEILGASGFTGFLEPSGFTGFLEPSGFTGFLEPSGFTGFLEPSGFTGFLEPSGFTGFLEPSGFTGFLEPSGSQ